MKPNQVQNGFAGSAGGSWLRMYVYAYPNALNFILLKHECAIQSQPSSLLYTTQLLISERECTLFLAHIMSQPPDSSSWDEISRSPASSAIETVESAAHKANAYWVRHFVYSTQAISNFAELEITYHGIIYRDETDLIPDALVLTLTWKSSWDAELHEVNSIWKASR